ncbi:sulfatase-like hydrolase/transferase [Aestuariivivens sediminis]|uniref:sulfatase-like hydrolase/transferase n=1 Tax=Aestuariivivens sediminis TaxID=2913557 RepID=UPI001F593B0D|nr:sulfatase-like hydrolase/transferase [Aestuariivivens sediminis]
MKRYIYLLVFIGSLISSTSMSGQSKAPNILLITMDDMSWDSPGICGGPIPDLTPHIDKLASEGILFEKAYVQAPNCSPSRSVIQTSLYPHQSGMRGFFYVEPNGSTLPEILKENGYMTGVINKLADTSLSPDSERYWDSSIGLNGHEKRSAKAYSEQLSGFLKSANTSGKPFYCVVNVADPHKPFFNDPGSKKSGFDDFKPSKLYTLNDITVPEFLPSHPKIKQELLNYYNSVKRGDDCVGEIISTINNRAYFENTIVILLSDHGMPFPFAKSSLYQNGIRTPLIVSWPNKIAKGQANKENLVSAVDIAPTILELIGISVPKTYQGHSFHSLVLGNKIESTDYIFAQFDENAGGIPRPSRTVLGKRYGYIFNPWATGKLPFRSAADYHTSYKVMKALAVNDTVTERRFKNWVFRATEELYDYANDPNALNNLIDDPKYQDVLVELREKLMVQLKVTNDYVLPAFENKNDKAFLNDWMEIQIREAKLRTKTIIWKRYTNSSGSTKNNTKLFKIDDLSYSGN